MTQQNSKNNTILRIRIKLKSIIGRDTKSNELSDFMTYIFLFVSEVPFIQTNFMSPVLLG